MRRKMNKQMPLVGVTSEHPRGHELAQMSALLDAMPRAVQLVHGDLTRGGTRLDTGREAMTAEQVLRVLIVKQMLGLSYDELTFFLSDSQSLRSFCRLSFGGMTPKRSTLQGNIKQVQASTLESINRLVVSSAVVLRVESGTKTRSDSTVVETNIHHPLDSSLLWDSVRVLSRLMDEALEWLPASTVFAHHTRRAKKRTLGILNARNMEARVALYKDLLRVTDMTVVDAERIEAALMKTAEPMSMARAAKISHFIALARKVIDQTTRRILQGESVPSTEKIVSIFEPHTDIIVKGGRDTLYGHKMFLTTGASGIVLDVVVERGNPADTNLATRLVKRVSKSLGKMPKQVSFDGGFSSQANLADIKELGVTDVAFHKHVGLEVEDMVRSPWVMKKLRNFRAGIEGGISWLKRSFGLDRCTWRGWDSFVSYVHGSVLACNLLVLARRLLAKA